MNIFGDPFAALGNAAQKRAAQGPAVVGGFPRNLSDKEWGRFQEFYSAGHAHEADMQDRYVSGATSATVAATRAAGSQERSMERLKHKHAMEQADKLSGMAAPGTTVEHTYGEGYKFTTPPLPTLNPTQMPQAKKPPRSMDTI